AAVLDLHVGARPRAEAVDQRVRGLAHRHDVADGHARAVSQVQGAESAGVHLLGIADDAIDLRHVRKAARLDLRRAAGYNEARTRALALEPADRLAGLADRLGGDGAGVDDDGVLEP